MNLNSLILAQTELFSSNFFIGIVGSFIFGLIGILLLTLGFKTFDLLLKGINIEGELKGNPNAIAIVVGSFLIALSVIVASVVH